MMTEKPISHNVSSHDDLSLLPMEENLNSMVLNRSSEERLSESLPSRGSLNANRGSAKKAKRVRFFRNGDKFYTGVVMAVTPERYRSFDSLATDLTRALVSNVTLPSGVRVVYNMEGKKIQDVCDLEDGKSYVVSGQGESFKKVRVSF